MVATAAELFRRQGYDATSWRQITAASGAPAGSIGYLFPEGKEQLAAEVAASASRRTREQIAALLDDEREPADIVGRWIGASARILKGSGYTDGCPIATLTLELAHRSDAVQAEVADGYDSWSDLFTEFLTPSHGASARDAAELLLAAFEGALLLSRARRSTAPLDRLAAHAEALLDSLVPR